MSRAHFILIANTIKLLPSFTTYQKDGSEHPSDVVNFNTICTRFAEALAPTNSLFKRDRFLAACHGKKGGR